jgi:hypothetical protein
MLQAALRNGFEVKTSYSLMLYCKAIFAQFVSFAAVTFLPSIAQSTVEVEVELTPKGVGRTT